MAVTTAKALKYALLPGVIPRTRDFFRSGFSHLALFMACVLASTSLLPPGHAYLNPANFGRYGVRHVLGEARRNLVFRRENIDQIIIYYSLLTAVFLIFFQFVILILSAAIHQAQAASFGAWLTQFFVTPTPANDIAFLLLDDTFGVRGLYGSIRNGTPGWPSPFHDGLHLFIRFYNLGILAVGLIIFLYLVATVVAETAQTGHPFGRRYNHWAPVRMILALALLMPFTYGTQNGPQTQGFNTAQVLTLSVAKWGSSLGTNGWMRFIQRIQTANVTPANGQPAQNMVINPNPPEFNALLEMMFVARTCLWAELWLNNRTIQAYQIHENNAWTMPATFNAALTNSQNKKIIIRFGERAPEYKEDAGSVKPLCGEIIFEIMDVARPGALSIQRSYYDLVRELWNDPSTDFFSRSIVERTLPVMMKDPNAPIPDATYINNQKIWYNNRIRTAITNARNAQINDPAWTAIITNRGWAGAGIWYNKIAELNGSFAAAIQNLPVPSRYPETMEYVKTQKEANDNFVTGPERFSPYMADNKMVNFRYPAEMHMALSLYYAQKFWSDHFGQTRSNTLIDTIRSIFGLDGLYTMVCSRDVHPFSQLVGIGRSLMQTAVGSLGVAFGSGIAGGLANILSQDPQLKKIASTVTSSTGELASTIGMIAVSLGFILYYVLPFIPFLYFFFAAATWVKTIFEAIVGLPLWALAHIRIDGEGLPGPAAMNGYFLIFEILIRPILIVAGLLAAISVFNACVTVLHTIWSQVVTNVMGSSAAPYCGANAPAGQTNSIEFTRDAVDSFFMTIIYTVVVYMTALSSFKLIDLIPSNILRWMGASVGVFMDFAGSNVDDLMEKTSGGALMISSQIRGGVSKLFARNGKAGEQ